MKDMEEFAMILAGYVGTVRQTRETKFYRSPGGWRAKIEALPTPTPQETPSVRVTLMGAGTSILVRPAMDAESAMRRFLV